MSLSCCLLSCTNALTATKRPPDTFVSWEAAGDTNLSLHKGQLNPLPPLFVLVNLDIQFYTNSIQVV